MDKLPFVVLVWALPWLVFMLALALRSARERRDVAGYAVAASHFAMQQVCRKAQADVAVMRARAKALENQMVLVMIVEADGSLVFRDYSNCATKGQYIHPGPTPSLGECDGYDALSALNKQ